MIENQQKPKAAKYDDKERVDVHSVFLTIQGEGPFSGERALFIRLAECNLQCPGCDTEYGSKGNDLFPGDTAILAQGNLPEGGLVVLTGGEPMRQNINPHINRLLTAGYRVQVETNGVLFAPRFEQRGTSSEHFAIVCSPKTNRIHDEIYRRATAFKYVLRAGEVDPEDGLPTRALLHPARGGVARPRPGAPVYVQPMDEGDEAANAANLQACIDSVMKHGHRLQIQLHKQIGME